LEEAGQRVAAGLQLIFRKNPDRPLAVRLRLRELRISSDVK
jgi:hypothetical protein